MIYLLIGIFLFLGAHSVRIWADPWRERMLERRRRPAPKRGGER